ncbi:MULTISPECIES: hypothetical protein [Carnobacterium]|uniref:Uncharacterized protein n=2 Tax=Carnobacterium inhibens TaxID=147709 RepID=U5SCM8_9LACT|nr:MULTISPECIES: hypothetical protein [Carnobacterium]AGY82796.1 hypothetical protein Q783_05080 [Carnobacterium inhibens subsp. gilichinskyi]MBC9824811.1 hypothetical protein [Carnobacterium inhibens]
MRKLSVALTMLSSLFVLTGCNTNNETAEAPTQSSTSQSDTSSSSSMEESAESTSSTSENVINSEEEAFNFIKEETGIEADNTDIAYELLESDEDSYTLKLVSKSLQEQGGSGAAGIYKVYKDGTYEIVA